MDLFDYSVWAGMTLDQLLTAVPSSFANKSCRLAVVFINITQGINSQGQFVSLADREAVEK